MEVKTEAMDNLSLNEEPLPDLVPCDPATIKTEPLDDEMMDIDPPVEYDLPEYGAVRMGWIGYGVDWIWPTNYQPTTVILEHPVTHYLDQYQEQQPEWIDSFEGSQLLPIFGNDSIHQTPL